MGPDRSHPSLLHPSGPREDAEEEEEEGGDDDDDEEDAEDGGTTAHLLFFPDGSAYLLSGGHVLLPKGYSGATATLPVSTLHVQDGGPNQGFTSTDQMSQNTSAPGEQPPSGAFHSYQLARASAPTTSAKNSPTEPKDAVTDGEGEAKVGQEEEPSWPPWLCLACRLSFRQGRSLAAHALSAHGVRLSPGERQALSRRVPAMLQGTALSFLEPNNPTSGVDLSAGMCSGWVNVMKEEEEEDRSPREGRNCTSRPTSTPTSTSWLPTCVRGAGPCPPPPLEGQSCTLAPPLPRPPSTYAATSATTRPTARRRCGCTCGGRGMRRASEATR
uniref:C2H2-type domain-containing protein n=1 Tax=Chelonoidis abingdonii TaxID=106734 RepID=A0A8C0G0S4_CHEAB